MIAAFLRTFDQVHLRQAFGLFPSGVTAFCGLVDGDAHGIAASSFTSVSLDPALVSVCVARSSTTWPKLATLEHVGLSILASDHGPIARSLASKSPDRFGDVDWVAVDSGAVFVRGAPLWLECRPHRLVEAGDHLIVLLQVTAVAMDAEVAPMVFHRSTFRELAEAL